VAINAFRSRASLIIAGFAACLLLLGCEVRQASVDPSGKLNILGSGSDVSDPRTSAEWTIAGATGGDGPAFTPTEIAGVRSLRVTSGRETAILYRRTDAIVQVAPYLSWAWNIEPHGGTGHPVRIVVGFRGGNSKSESWAGRTLGRLGADFPPYDRMLSIGWDASALRRGHMAPARENPLAPRHYVVRGGMENAGDWRLETVDLVQLYQMAWPNDVAREVKVVFIGIAALKNGQPASASISGLVLSR
jgi:hypothetical protein